MSKFQNYERLKRAGATVRLDLYLITKAEIELPRSIHSIARF